MRTRDKQFGKPHILYKDTQANIEAMSLPEGSAAYATDLDKLGYKTSSGWTWVAGGGDRIAAHATSYVASNYTPPNGTWVKPTTLSSSNDIGTAMNTTTHVFTPPADTIFVGSFAAGITGRAYSGFSVAFYENGSRKCRSLTHYYGSYNIWVTSYYVGLGNGTSYYEPYVYRASNGYLNNSGKLTWMAWNI